MTRLDRALFQRALIVTLGCMGLLVMLDVSLTLVMDDGSMADTVRELIRDLPKQISVFILPTAVCAALALVSVTMVRRGDELQLRLGGRSVFGTCRPLMALALMFGVIGIAWQQWAVPTFSEAPPRDETWHLSADSSGELIGVSLSRRDGRAKGVVVSAAGASAPIATDIPLSAKIAAPMSLPDDLLLASISHLSSVQGTLHPGSRDYRTMGLLKWRTVGVALTMLAIAILVIPVTLVAIGDRKRSHRYGYTLVIVTLFSGGAPVFSESLATWWVITGLPSGIAWCLGPVILAIAAQLCTAYADLRHKRTKTAAPVPQQVHNSVRPKRG